MESHKIETMPEAEKREICRMLFFFFINFMIAKNISQGRWVKDLCIIP